MVSLRWVLEKDTLILTKYWSTQAVILLPAHPVSFTHNLVSGMESFISTSPWMQWYCRLVMKKKQCFELISLQLDSWICETASPKTRKPKFVNE